MKPDRIRIEESVKRALDEGTITLRTGESLSDFQEALRGGLQPIVAEALFAGVGDHCYWYVEDILGDAAIVYASRYQEPAFRAYFRTEYKRSEEGLFAFGALEESRRKVTYEVLASPTIKLPVPPPPAEEEAEAVTDAMFAAPFRAGEDGRAYVAEGGDFDAVRSAFRHHHPGTKDQFDDSTVSLGQLRRALLTVPKADLSSFGRHAEQARRVARAHLEAHADRILAQAKKVGDARPVLALLSEDLRALRNSDMRALAERLTSTPGLPARV